MARDYYEALGVQRSADEKEIRGAFRKLARQYHPDLNHGDESAERKFKEINEANEVLSDPDKRVKYNRDGDNWMHADRIEAQGGGDIFVGASPYGAGARAYTLRHSRPGRSNHHDVPVTITLEEAFRGTKRMVNVPTKDGGTRRIEVCIPAAWATARAFTYRWTTEFRSFSSSACRPHANDYWWLTRGGDVF